MPRVPVDFFSIHLLCYETLFRPPIGMALSGNWLGQEVARKSREPSDGAVSDSAFVPIPVKYFAHSLSKH